MSLALLALLGLLIVLVVGALRPDVNVGILALAVTFLIAVGLAGRNAAQVAELFPSGLVLTVVGVSLLFGLAGQNGTLEVLTSQALQLVRGGGRTLPLVFFALSGLIAELGPGNIAAVALLAPVALPLAVRCGVNPVLMTVMLCTGANAGTFSPVAVTGSLNMALLEGIGLNGAQLALPVFASVAALQTLSAALAYAVFQGWHLDAAAPEPAHLSTTPATLTRGQGLTWSCSSAA